MRRVKLPKADGTRTVYRDRKTGRFAKESAWKRSRAHGGRRYVRQRTPLRKVAKPPTKPPPVEPEPEEIEELELPEPEEIEGESP